MAVDTEATQVLAPAAEELPGRTPRGLAVRLAVGGLLVGGLLVVIGVVPDLQANRISFAMIFAIAGLSMNMLLGYAGQISLGHQAFFGIGAFMSGYVVTTARLPFPIAILAAAASGGVAALILGGVALRVRGLYLALVTLAYGAVAERTIFLFRPFTGGGAGLEAPRPTWASSDKAYAYFVLGVLAAILFFDWRFVRTKAGRAVQAVRDSERVAASMGINVTAYKLLAFVLSGLVAGLAGGLFAQHETVVVAAPFNFFLALEFVLMTVVGGLGSRAGVVAGSAFFALLDKFFPQVYQWVDDVIRVLPNWDEARIATLVPAIGAGLLIVTLIQFPGGIGQQLQPLVRWFAGERLSFKALREAKPASTGGVDVRP